MRAIPSCRSSRWINGKPPRPNRNLMTRIRRRLQQIPGANFLISQPIQQRVDELVSGVRSEATVKVIGEDLDILRNTAEKNSGHYERHSRGRDVRVEQLFDSLT